MGSRKSFGQERRDNIKQGINQANERVAADMLKKSSVISNLRN